VNRFVKNRSLLYSLSVWAFVIALSADFANIDDLFNLATVLHEDQDVLSGQVQDHHPSDHSLANFATAVPAMHPGVIVDQDSASLEAEVDACELAVMDLPADPDLAIASPPASCEALYIRHHKLLI
jgi:hypothetical protein